MKKIIFVRHGESTENLANKKVEKYDESKIVLTKDGIKQVKVTGKYLHKTFKKTNIKIYIFSNLNISNNIINIQEIILLMNHFVEIIKNNKKISILGLFA